MGPNCFDWPFFRRTASGIQLSRDNGEAQNEYEGEGCARSALDEVRESDNPVFSFNSENTSDIHLLGDTGGNLNFCQQGGREHTGYSSHIVEN